MSKTLAGTRKRISEPHEEMGTIPTSLAALNKHLHNPSRWCPAESALCWAEARSARSWVRRRAARRSGRPARPSVRPSGGPRLRPCSRRSRHRAAQVVRHQRGQALQARREGQAAASSEADGRRSDALSMVVLKELEFVRPQLVVALGATAALALSGAPVTIGRSRGPAQVRSAARLYYRASLLSTAHSR